MRIFVPHASWLPASAAIAALLSAACIILPSAGFGPFAMHMAAHIAVMNIVAPLCAIVIAGAANRGVRSEAFWAAVILQIAALWLWHLPALQHFSAHGVAGALAMNGSLFLAATAFWTALLRLRGTNRWLGVVGLLITGKLSCLLAALLVFAPRPLYPLGQHVSHSLADQQMAGLLMITACPLSYVVAGIVMTAQLIGHEPARGPRHVNPT